MGSWRDRILKEFTQQVSRLTLVADPDGLLLEEGVLQGIRERGFELIPFDDHVAFRYVYESQFRTRWDNGEKTELVVVLRSSLSDLSSLPFDLLNKSRRLSFSLGELFPSLSYPVVASLDTADLDSLYKAQEEHIPGDLADNGTKDFILRHVFGIASEVIRKESDLLSALLRRHYQGLRIPATIEERLIKILQGKKVFAEWPLETIVPDKEAFYSFLQERWKPFLDTIGNDASTVAVGNTAYGLKLRGPIVIPFGHDDVRIYIDNLFAEGLLKPVTTENKNIPGNRWLSIGIRDSLNKNIVQRIEALIAGIENSIPGENARYQDWLLFAVKYAELRSLQYRQQTDAAMDGKIASSKQLSKNIAWKFSEWVMSRFAGLYNQAPIPPVMVHHVPRALARWRQDEKSKVALIVIDGMSLNQWYTIKAVLDNQIPSVIMREQCLFTWVPTVTSVCRQAIFAGKIPLYFPESIYSNKKHAALWRAYWADHGVPSQNVEYFNGLDEQTPNVLESKACDESIEVLGLIIQKVDKIVHGMELGMAGMHNQVRQWAESGFLSTVITKLLDNGFIVAITSDHGNTEAYGIGKPAEGAIADLRGERVRIYKRPFPNRY
jgi:hypothetical protein